jgi:ABC-type transport system involved in multi-copper enzyme maturation, permease component
MNAVFQCAFKESLRKRAFLIMSIISALYIVLWTVMLQKFTSSLNPHMAGDIAAQLSAGTSSLVFQIGLQFSSMLLCFVTINLGSGIIASEIETGLILGIISRPVRRSSYVFGRLLGITMLVVIFGTVMYTLILAIGAAYSLSPVIALNPVQALLGWIFYLLVPVTVLCPTTFGSVFIKAVANGLLMIFVYMLGNIGGMVEMIGKFLNNSSAIDAGILMSLFSPFHELYLTAERVLVPTSGIAGDMMRGLGGLSGGGDPPSVWMYVYIVIYAVLFLLFAVKRFKKTDINI